MTDHTPDDLRGMGLVTLAEYDALLAKYKEIDKAAAVMNGKLAQLYHIITKDSYAEPAKEPQPTREFQVRDKVKVKENFYHSVENDYESEIISIEGKYFKVPWGKYTQLIKAADLELISAEPEIPDWIAKGRWVCAKEYPKYGKARKIQSVNEHKVCYADGEEDIGTCIANRMPFTPPPMPELPRGFAWCKEWITFMDVTPMPVKAWAVAIQAHPDGCYLSGLNKQETVNQLLAIQAHIEKWGTE